MNTRERLLRRLNRGVHYNETEKDVYMYNLDSLVLCLESGRRPKLFRMWIGWRNRDKRISDVIGVIMSYNLRYYLDTSTTNGETYVRVKLHRCEDPEENFLACITGKSTNSPVIEGVESRYFGDCKFYNDSTPRSIPIRNVSGI